MAARAESSRSSDNGPRPGGSTEANASTGSSPVPSNSSSGRTTMAATTAGSNWPPRREATASMAAIAPALRSKASRTSPTCEMRVARLRSSPATSGTPAPSQREYDCSTARRTSSSRPSCWHKTPAAEQWLAIWAMTVRPPVAISLAACRARPMGPAPAPAWPSMKKRAPSPPRSTIRASERKATSSPKTAAASSPYTPQPTWVSRAES